MDVRSARCRDQPRRRYLINVEHRPWCGSVWLVATRRTQEITIGDLAVTSQALPYEKAEDILPDVLRIVTSAIDKVRTELGPNGVTLIANIEKVKTEEDLRTMLQILMPAITSIADSIGNGVLKRLAPLIMAGTTVVIADETGKKENVSLVKTADRAQVFEAHPEAYFPILFFAGKVTFSRFFSVAGLIGKGPAKAA